MDTVEHSLMRMFREGPDLLLYFYGILFFQ